MPTHEHEDQVDDTMTMPHEDDPTARARRDGETLAATLTEEQRRRAAGTADRAIAADRLAEERLAVLQAGPEPSEEEYASALAVLETHATHRRWDSITQGAECGVIAIGTVFLVAGGLGLLLSSDILLGVGAIALVVATFLLGVQSLAGRRSLASAREALVDWASDRPGQFARGLPVAGIPATGSDGRLGLPVVLGATLGLLVTAIGVGLVLDGGSAVTLVVGAVVLLGTLALLLARRRAGRRDQALASALEWLPTSLSDEDEDDPDGEDGNVEDGGEDGQDAPR